MRQHVSKLVLLLGLLCLMAFQIQEASSKTAICVLTPTQTANNANIKGTLTIMEDEITGQVNITGQIQGFPANSIHGMHVHQNGDISDVVNGTATGSHFNPEVHNHDNDLSNVNRHVGDMGNVTADANGLITVSITEGLLFTLSGNMSVVGRAIIVHQRRDIGAADNKTGDAGARYAQCVIGIKNEVGNQAMADEPGSTFKYATCSLVGETSDTIYGMVSIVPSGNDVTVSAKVCGLTDGDHGFHIHTFGDMTGAIATVGSHYNPLGYNHSLPTQFDAGNHVGHVGDMGNLVSANETATFSATFSMPELSGSQSIVGRAIVIHSGKDNGAASQPSGASGTMLARCVIGITDKQVSLTNVVCPTKEQPVESSTAQPSSAAKVGASNIFYATLILVLLSVVALF